MNKIKSNQKHKQDLGFVIMFFIQKLQKASPNIPKNSTHLPQTFQQPTKNPGQKSDHEPGQTSRAKTHKTNGKTKKA